MKKFLWFNITKLKTDSEYFVVSYIYVITAQVGFYSSFIGNKNLFYDLILGIISSIFFIYITFMKKDFKILDAITKAFK
ncbi:MAG: hypothetical protein ACRDCB_02430 [Clostridium sp.]